MSDGLEREPALRVAAIPIDGRVTALHDGRHVRLDVTFRGEKHGIGIWAHRDDHITRVMTDSGRFYEDGILERLALLSPEGVYIDVGAHVGVHTLCYASYFPCTEVVAIEPDYGNYEVLCKNARACSRKIIVCRAAAGRSDQRWGEVMDRNPKNTGMKQVRVCRASEVATMAPTDGVAIVEVDRLVDDLYGLPRDHRTDASPCWTSFRIEPKAPAARVGLIKIDVEGMELDVLSGAERTIQTHRPVLVIETITAGQTAAVKQFLRPYGYDTDGPYGATPTYIHYPKRTSGP